MKKVLLALFILLHGMQSVWCQYMPNPSFEGTPQANIPPPDWEICSYDMSTPDVQPGFFDVYLPPSDGSTYLGMTTRPDYTWEDVQTHLETPLSPDSCYVFKIDFAYQQYVSGYNMQPTTLKIYGSSAFCDKSVLYWQSPAISNTDWEEYEFILQPQSEINYIVLESFYPGSIYDWGYILMDNIRIHTTPFTDLGPDTTLQICGDTVLLDAGEGFTSYLWSDGSTNQELQVTEPGLYWVKVYNELGCSWTDSINITQENYVEMQSEMAGLVIACIGQDVTLHADISGGIAPYSYQWHDLPDTTQSITITAWETGYYTVTVTDMCGYSLTDSIKVEVINDLDFSLGADTILCPGNWLVLNPGVPGDYQWQNGSTASTFTVTEPGLYWLIVNSDCGIDSDSILVNYYPDMEINLGQDTAFCFGGNLLLDPGTGFVSYQWQDGSNSPYYDVSSSGIYSVTVTDLYGCTGEDEIQVEVSELLDLPPDTTICSGEPLTLIVMEDFDYFEWNDGTTGNSLIITNEGKYWLTAGYDYGCETSDTILVNESLLPVTDLGIDREACEGESITVTVEPGPYEYYWNGVQGTNTITISQDGPLELCVKNDCGQDCDTILITIFPFPSVELGSDRLLMPGEQVILDGGNGYAAYLWQNGSQERYLPVTWEDAFENQIYWVEVDDGHCKNSDTIFIESFSLIVPDVITPNGDNKNDVFRPGENFNGISEHTIIVFNRWGEKVWESTDFQSGWDGKVNGRYVAEGVYYWVLEMKMGSGDIKKTAKGSVTVLGGK